MLHVKVKLKMYIMYPVLKAGHPGVPSYYMFVCLGYGWVGYFTFLFFLISLS